jgi:hypothetical protein
MLTIRHSVTNTTDSQNAGALGSHTALLEGVKGQPAVVPTEEPSFPGQEPTA